MSDSSATGDDDARGSSRSRRREAGGGPIAALVLFVNQILDELRKVVRPTRDELTTYTAVVIVFVVVIIILIYGLDTLLTHVVSWVFGG